LFALFKQPRIKCSHLDLSFFFLFFLFLDFGQQLVVFEKAVIIALLFFLLNMQCGCQENQDLPPDCWAEQPQAKKLREWRTV
jgi:hypothetical protein